MKNQSETLLDKAVQNLNCAKTIYDSKLIEDEAYLNYVGYHLQQAVELSIKYLLEMNGVEYGWTHDIEQLILLSKEREIDLCIPKYIDDRAEMFSSWESKTRYIKNYKLEKRKVSAALVEVEKYINILLGNGETLDEEENDEAESDFMTPSM